MDAPRYTWVARTSHRPLSPKLPLSKAVESQGANLNSPSLVDTLWNQKNELPQRSYISLNFQKQRFQVSDGNSDLLKGNPGNQQQYPERSILRKAKSS
jgi:hypothetical protein